MESWLSLTISDPFLPRKEQKKRQVLISVPKRLVRRAVRRNRIKRVLREAMRLDPFFDKEAVYRLKVLRSPENVSLKQAKDILNGLKHSC